MANANVALRSVQPLTPAEVSFGNPIEHLRRAAKVQKLLSASDLLARSRGLDPERDAQQVLDQLTGRDFEQLVRTTGVNKPSPQSVSLFLAELRRRAQRVA